MYMCINVLIHEHVRCTKILTYIYLYMYTPKRCCDCVVKECQKCISTTVDTLQCWDRYSIWGSFGEDACKFLLFFLYSIKQLQFACYSQNINIILRRYHLKVSNNVMKLFSSLQESKIFQLSCLLQVCMFLHAMLNKIKFIRQISYQF